jgi:predicted enzyme related to lactoylglutathione lyase
VTTRPKPGAVIFAKDIERLAKFYAGLLFMAVVHGERGHIVLESQDAQLVLHALPEHVAQSIQMASPPQLRANTAIKLFFSVDDLAQARATAERLGGQLNSPQQEWEARGFRACDGHDPEGNVFQLRAEAA